MPQCPTIIFFIKTFKAFSFEILTIFWSSASDSRALVLDILRINCNNIEHSLFLFNGLKSLRQLCCWEMFLNVMTFLISAQSHFVYICCILSPKATSTKTILCRVCIMSHCVGNRSFLCCRGARIILLLNQHVCWFMWYFQLWCSVIKKGRRSLLLIPFVYLS